MDNAKIIEALMLAEEAKKQMAASQSTLQPSPQDMGAIGHPDGPMASPQYSGYNRV